ncbi:hypothetical protein EV715DRAFT_212331 [Schizophyllum commune]
MITWSSSAGRALAMIRPTSLISLDVQGLQNAIDFRNFSAYVHKFCGSLALEKLVIISQDFTGGGPSTPGVRPLVLDDIRSLLSFVNLTDVHIHFYGVHLKDADVDLIARSWPRLRRLRLYAIRWNTQERPACTLNSLLSFAQHCPLLEELQFIVDATTIVVPSPASIPFPRAHDKLRALNLMHSPIASSEDVASFLTRFFPYIDPGRLLSYSGIERMEARWTSVRLMIPVLLDARIVGIHGGCKA